MAWATLHQLFSKLPAQVDFSTVRLLDMLDSDNIKNKSVSEAVDKIPADEKDYRKYSFICFNL